MAVSKSTPKGLVVRFRTSAISATMRWLLMVDAPSLDESKLDQIAALPLGGRIKLDPWRDKVEMVKTAPVSITSARDKMPFEVTPFFPRLTRLGATAATTDSTNPTTAQNTDGKN